MNFQPNNIHTLVLLCIILIIISVASSSSRFHPLDIHVFRGNWKDFLFSFSLMRIHRKKQQGEKGMREARNH